MSEQTRRHNLAKRIAAASWGAFLLWIGICFAMQITWGVGLLGVAAIVLGTQAIRATATLRVQGGWVVIGCFFAASGVWHLLDVRAELGPVVLIAAGAAILLGALFGQKLRRGHQ